VGGFVIELRKGDWRTVLADVVECDAVITDPPYTERTVLGYKSANMVGRQTGKSGECLAIDYGSADESTLRELASWAADVVRRWVVIFNDHIGWRWVEDELSSHGLYTFSPVVWLRRNAPPRFNADGPNDSVEYICVARRRGKEAMDGCRPGYYDCLIESLGRSRIRIGQKPINLMRAIIRDYTKPGDLIADPFAGSGTTLIAARAEGRDCIGAEIDPETYKKALARIETPHNLEMFT
jgi:hypothetical protein